MIDSLRTTQEERVRYILLSCGLINEFVVFRLFLFDLEDFASKATSLLLLKANARSNPCCLYKVPWAQGMLRSKQNN